MSPGLGTAFIRGGLLTRIVSALYRIAFRRSATIFFQNEEDRDLFLAEAAGDAGAGAAAARFGRRPRPISPDAEGVATDDRAPSPSCSSRGCCGTRASANMSKPRGACAASFPATRFQLLGFLDVENRHGRLPRARSTAGWQRG